MKPATPHSSMARRWGRLRDTQLVIWFILLLLVGYGIYQSISLAWLSDDAFISYRYAKNLIEGHGLVFNAGERVEGYTNFLWTILIAVAMALGSEPILPSHVLSIGSYLVTALVLVVLSIRLWRSAGGPSRLIIPIAAFMWLVQYDAHVYATSGLETAWATMLTMVAYALLITGDSPRRALIAGLMLTLGMLSRPDGMIFFLLAVPYVVLLFQRRWTSLAAYVLPMVIIYVPYWLLRYQYYGYPFPNTYYAKSVSIPYYSQGLAYLWLYVKTYYVLFLVIPALAALLVWSIRRHRREDLRRHAVFRVALLAGLWVIPFAFYVVRVGGDFMLARFFIPITPLTFLVLEGAVVAFVRRRRLRLVAAAALVACVLLRWNHFPHGAGSVNGIVDERVYNTNASLALAQQQGQRLKDYLRGLEVTVGFVGTFAKLVYYADLPVAIECHTGLTDEHIAHLPLTKRGRPGHEKPAPYSYLLRREVNFFFFSHVKPNIGPYDRLVDIRFGDLNAQIVVYENKVMDQLKAYPEIRFIDFPAYLDRYPDTVASLPPDVRARDSAFFEYYYFQHNNDPQRYQAVMSALRR